jgi:hypothetical protein
LSSQTCSVSSKALWEKWKDLDFFKLKRFVEKQLFVQQMKLAKPNNFVPKLLLQNPKNMLFSFKPKKRLVSPSKANVFCQNASAYKKWKTCVELNIMEKQKKPSIFVQTIRFDFLQLAPERWPHRGLQLTFNGLLLCRDFLFVSPELKPIGKPMYKIYSSAHLRSVSQNCCR